MKNLVGVIVSNKMQKTVVVEIKKPYTHPIYKKTMQRTVRIKARNEQEISLGDTVSIVPTKPLAKSVHYKVDKILGKGKQV